MKIFKILIFLLSLAKSEITEKKSTYHNDFRKLTETLDNKVYKRLRHIMNRRNQVFPGSRVLTDQELNMMKSINVNHKNDLYGFAWVNGKFQSLFNADHIEDEMKQEPKLLAHLEDRFRRREVQETQMDCILSG